MGKAVHNFEDGGGKRMLAAIVFTDVVGYSARMQADEEGTEARARADFAEMSALATAHGGEVLQQMGDGLLLCFTSAVEAIAAARAMQAMAVRKAGDEGEEALAHRFGVHLGDIIRKESGVVGSGVNIAARLQALAPPNAICLSGSIHELTRKRLPAETVAMGRLALKNIDEKVSVYRLDPPASDFAAMAAPGRRRGRLLALWGVTAAALLTFAGIVFWQQQRAAEANDAPVPTPADSALTPAADPAPPLTPPGEPVASAAEQPPRIAVLPFANLSPDPDNAWFADGMTEELINALARVEGLEVAARTSVFALRGKNLGIAEIAELLNAGYLLEGSVRRAGDQVRISTQLINAATGATQWSETFQRKMADIFALQDEVGTAITGALRAELGAAPLIVSERPTESIAAYNHFLRGRFEISQRTFASIEQGVAQLEKAVSLDPGFAAAWATLANARQLAFVYGGMQVEATAKGAVEAAERALVLAPDLAVTHTALGGVEFLIRNALEAATAHFETALRLDPDEPQALHWYGLLLLNGRNEPARALDLFLRAEEVDPLSPVIKRGIANALVGTRRYREAAERMERLIQLDAGYAREQAVVSDLVALRLFLGEMDQALETVYALQRERPLSDSETMMLAHAEILRGHIEEAAAFLEEPVTAGFAKIWKQMLIGRIEAFRGQTPSVEPVLAAFAAMQPGAMLTPMATRSIELLGAYGFPELANRFALRLLANWEERARDEESVTQPDPLLPLLVAGAMTDTTAALDRLEALRPLYAPGVANGTPLAAASLPIVDLMIAGRRDEALAATRQLFLHARATEESGATFLSLAGFFVHLDDLASAKEALRAAVATGYVDPDGLLGFAREPELRMDPEYRAMLDERGVVLPPRFALEP